MYDGTLDLAVLLDPVTSLPYIIRSYENHSFFGRVTQDLVVHDYTTVNGVGFPRRFKTIFNREYVVSDYSVDSVIVNSDIASTSFKGPAGRLPEHAPRRDRLYDFAEIGEFNSFYSWNGQYAGTFENVTAVNPWADLPGVWLVTVTNAPGVRQLVIEVGNSVVVLDAPPHQSLLIIQWVRERLGKSVTHIWVSGQLQCCGDQF